MFLLTEDVMLGTSTDDFEFIPNTSIGGYPYTLNDLLIIKTPGKYVFVDEPYLSKTLHVEVEMTTKNLNKIISLVAPDSDLISYVYLSGIQVYPQHTNQSEFLVVNHYDDAKTRQEIEFILMYDWYNESQQVFPIVPIKNIKRYQPA